MLRAPCECIKSLQRIVHSALLERLVLVFYVLFVAFSNRVSYLCDFDEDRGGRKKPRVGQTKTSRSFLSLSLTNPIHVRGKSKSEEKSHQKHPIGDKDDEKVFKTLFKRRTTLKEEHIWKRQ